jgi:hypothetical protein
VDITRPLSGEVKIEHCDAVIRSVEIQLVRIEVCCCFLFLLSSSSPFWCGVFFLSHLKLQTVGGAEIGFTKEATEVQNIQIADGDPPRGIPISIHMIFPRLFTCPSVASKSFKVEFAVNLVCLLSDGHLISENFPLQLVRRESSFMY